MRIVSVWRRVNMKIPIVRVRCNHEWLYDVAAIPQALHKLQNIAISKNHRVAARHSLVI